MAGSAWTWYLYRQGKPFNQGPSPMMTFSRCRAEPQDSTGAILLLSLLWLLAVQAHAGELSEVPATAPPDLSLPDLTGQQHGLDAYTGKVVLVTFWASWCSPCIKEMPSIQRLAEAMADQPFTVLGVNVGEGERRVQATASRLGIGFPVLLDKDSATFGAWGADVLPTAYVIDRSGRMRHVARGPVEWDRDDIIEMLKQLAAQEPPGQEKPSQGFSVNQLADEPGIRPGSP